MWPFEKKQQEILDVESYNKLIKQLIDLDARISNHEGRLNVVESNYTSIRNRLNRRKIKEEEEEEEETGIIKPFSPFGK